MTAYLAPLRFLSFLTLIAVLQMAAIFHRADLVDDPATLVLLFSVFALLILVNGLGYAAVHFAARHWTTRRKLFVAGSVLTVLIAVLMYYYWLFNQHLDWQNLLFAFDGIAHGEAGVDATVALKIFGAIALLVALVWGLSRVLWWRANTARDSLSAIIISIAVLNIVAFAARAGITPNDASYEAQAFVPWVSLLPRRPQPVLVEFPVPIERGGLFELDQIANLQQTKVRVLGDEVSAASKPNILFVHLESLRADIFNADNMPNLTARAQDTLQSLPRHFTTGPNTGTGMNGLLNGLSGVHYQAVRHRWFKPLTLPLLKKLGYQIKVYSTRGLGYEDMGELYFDESVDRVHMIDKGDIAAREEQLAQLYLDELAQDDGRPRFDYLMFYATHYDYFFPDAYAKYQPVEKLGFEIKSGKNAEKSAMRDGLFNRYRNAAYFVDDLMNRIVLHLKNSGRLANTVVVITGDHGEEFWEHGVFGHTHGLVNEQIQVPALVHFPRALPMRYRFTSHADFMPTIFDLMQVRTAAPVCEIMTGRSLYNDQPDDDYVLAALGVTRKNKKFTEMLMMDRYKVRFDFRDTLRVTGVYDLDDHPLDTFDADAIRAQVTRAIDARRDALRGDCANPRK